jgi:hypothetical protein
MDCCNLGYARGRCPHFPEGAGPDALRFAVARHSGSLVSLCCVAEKDYLPFSRAALEFDIASKSFTAPPVDAILERQAWAYVTSFIHRKQHA